MHKRNRKLEKKLLQRRSKHIRIYVEDRLKECGVFEINGVNLRSCTREALQEAFITKFGKDPSVVYIEGNYNIQNEIKNSRDNFTNGDYIYFYVTSDFEYVKIGYSQNPHERLKSVQTGCPLELKMIGYFKGDRNEESRLHNKYKHLNTYGEWFINKGDLLRYVIYRFYVM